MPLSEWKPENDFLPTEVPARLIGSRKEQNLKRTTPSVSPIVCSISFICLDLSWEADWASSSSIASGIVISSDLRSFGVKTWGLSPWIWNKSVSFQFVGKVRKNYVMRFVDINEKSTLYVIEMFLKLWNSPPWICTSSFKASGIIGHERSTQNSG